MPFCAEEFDGWPSERRMPVRGGGYCRVIDTVRVEYPKIVLGQYAIEYDCLGLEIARDEPWDTVTLYLH